MLHVPGGQWIHGEVNSTNATGGVAFTFTDANGGAVTIGATQRLIVYDFSVSVAAAQDRVVVAQNTDVAGKRIFAAALLTGFPAVETYLRPFEMLVGITPKLFTGTAQQVDAQLNGELVEV